VEIGPSDTLKVMAKRTIKSQYEAKDAALSTKRQLLSGEGDLAEIYYEVAPQPEAISSSKKESIVAPPPYTPAPERASEPARPPPAATAGSSSKKPDVPVSALEIIVGIVAQKLKKATDEISTSSTIKSLVSGMSSTIPSCIAH